MGTFRCRYMQQGDCNAPATFMKLMNYILRDGIGRFLYVYLDDIFIYSDTYEDHKNHIRWVCNQLKKHNLQGEKEKCEFMPESLHVLGNVITKAGIKADLNKITSIKEWPIPKTRT